MFTCLDFLQFKYFILLLCSLYFKIPVPENYEFLFDNSNFVVAATNLGVLVSILVPDALKATQILMVIASPAFYHQWIYFTKLYDARFHYLFH